MKIKDFAKEFEQQKMKNIVELEVIRTDQEIFKESRTDMEGKKYEVIFIIKDDDEYRFPPSAVAQLKVLMEEKPELVTFKVTKTGEGKLTKYQVIPL